MTVHINYEKCIACCACIDICPSEALELIDDVVIWAHPELCESCGICIVACPKEAITLDDES